MKRLNTNLRAGILSVVLAMCGLVATAQVNVTQSFVNGTFPGEVGWEVIDPGNNVVYCFPAGGGIPPAVSNLNLAPGVYSVQAYDSFGRSEERRVGKESRSQWLAEDARGARDAEAVLGTE